MYSRPLAGPMVRIVPVPFREDESIDYLEKALLARRGVLGASHVRRPTITLDPDGAAYAEPLMDRVLAVIADVRGDVQAAGAAAPSRGAA